MLQKLGGGEILLIVALLLLIVGPSKLPQLGRSIGESIREFKKSFKSVASEEPAASAAQQPSPKQG